MAKDGKTFRGQYDDEEVLLVFRKHPVIMRKGLIMFMFALLIGTIPVYLVEVPTMELLGLGLLGGFVLGLFLMMPSWIYWYFSVYIVTDQRFIQVTQKGFFNKKVIDLALNQIQMVNYEVIGVQETLLGFGTINVQTFVGNLTIHDVHKPEEIQKELLEILRSRGIATHTASTMPSNMSKQDADGQEED